MQPQTSGTSFLHTFHVSFHRLPSLILLSLHANRASDPTILTIPGHSSVQYLVWSGRDTNDDTTLNIYIAKLANPTTVSGARLEISSADYAWEKIGDGGGERCGIYESCRFYLFIIYCWLLKRHASFPLDPAINEAPQVLISPQNEVYIVYSASGAWTADYTLGKNSNLPTHHPPDPITHNDIPNLPPSGRPPRAQRPSPTPQRFLLLQAIQTPALRDLGRRRRTLPRRRLIPFLSGRHSRLTDEQRHRD
ncbi:hypothetical protein BC936DRAFT_146566 [Jimgerdemannia flammicorona]|uniref:Uncharacterized protein n=1 Tax=Jimgerdemannia flammicorona TaxID=994334 RepID=A0A433D805_9FUNG|nr:hypothetical protein BC936DRAFT_146566 [Jimgerdemannia flammicorona]